MAQLSEDMLKESTTTGANPKIQESKEQRKEATHKQTNKNKKKQQKTQKATN